MLRSALVLAAMLALPACATGSGSWQEDGWRGNVRLRGHVAEARAGHTPYPHAAGWWGGPAPTAASFGPHLAGHGRWVGHGQYGRVWLPRVAPGWQPYRFGRWIEHPRWGRTWVSAEPFGWITFHYGRWGFDPRLGWFWVPGGAFAPHWADVRWSAGWLSWAPLPPPGWAGWGRWRWGAGGWGHGDPGWVYAPRSAHRPGWTARTAIDRAEFDRMQRAPTPALPKGTPVAPPVVAQPSPVLPGWTRARAGSAGEAGRPAWQARTRDRGPQDGGAPQETRRPPPAATGSTPAATAAVRPGLQSPGLAGRPLRPWLRSIGEPRPERSAPPARPAAARGGLEQGASASEP